MQYASIMLSALAFTLLFAIEDTISKKVVSAFGRVCTAVGVISIGLLPMLILPLLYESSPVSLVVIILSIISGIFLALGYILIYTSVRSEIVTTTYTLAEIQPALLVIFGLFVLGEGLSTAKALSILVIFIGVPFLFMTELRRMNRKLLPAMFANFSWSIYWIILILGITYAHEFILPLLISRIAALALSLPFATFNKAAINEKEKIAKVAKGDKGAVAGSVILLLLVMGIFDGIGNGLASYVFFMKSVALGGAISAMGPVFVALLGYMIYKDRLTKLQLVGFLIMVLGAVALAFA